MQLIKIPNKDPDSRGVFPKNSIGVGTWTLNL